MRRQIADPQEFPNKSGDSKESLIFKAESELLFATRFIGDGDVFQSETDIQWNKKFLWNNMMKQQDQEWAFRK